MLKKILSIASLYLAAPAMGSCGQAVSTTDPSFCSSFKTVAMCQCAQYLSSGYCEKMGMDGLYKQMIAARGSLERACNTQRDTDPQTCMDDWNCYRNGGHDSKGGACSSTGQVCQ